MIKVSAQKDNINFKSLSSQTTVKFAIGHDHFLKSSLKFSNVILVYRIFNQLDCISGRVLIFIGILICNFLLPYFFSLCFFHFCSCFYFCSLSFLCNFLFCTIFRYRLHQCFIMACRSFRQFC